jgi:hypothetical protein
MDPNTNAEPPEEIADEAEGFTAVPSQTQEQSLALGDAQTVMRRFNRTTTWVATGLLSTMIIAAGALVFQDNHPMVADVAEETRGTGGAIVSDKSPDPLSEGAGLSGKNIDQTTAAQLASSEPGFTSETNNPELPTKVRVLSGTERQEPARAIQPRIRNLKHRLAFRSRWVDLRMRLIKLWHHSLARVEKSRGWTLFSYPHQTRSKKVSYSIETSH